MDVAPDHFADVVQGNTPDWMNKADKIAESDNLGTEHRQNQQDLTDAKYKLCLALSVT